MGAAKARAVAAEIEEYIGGPGLSNNDAQLLGDLVASIQRSRERLSTAELLRVVIAKSRAKASPTHHLFEWDLAKGHAIYLLDRARQLVASIRIRYADKPEEPVRAMQIVVLDGKRGYVPMGQVLQSRDMTAAVLEQAKADLEMWRKRYERLRDLAALRGVFAAIEKVRQ